MPSLKGPQHTLFNAARKLGADTHNHLRLLTDTARQLDDRHQLLTPEELKILDNARETLAKALRRSAGLEK